ncbi:MAG: hypothetical protein LBC19_05020 [Tannerella sp.]|jgi:hypothetical protein|nr:hypothetical protein [Tannerella sp.]
MKKIFNYSIFVWISILLLGCSTDSYDETGLSDIPAGREAEEFGKQLGDNLRFVVTQMNKNGDDFGDLAKIKTAIVKYLPQQTRVKSISVEDLDRTLQRGYRFTPVQITFLEKIREAQSKSSSADEFMQHLKEIIKEIQATVPEIQQRNLLKMTVALFYITKEMDSLLKEGLMPVDLKQPQYIRLRSGSESDGYWAALWAGVCVSASDIGASVLAGLEVMASAAGYCLIAVAGCLLLTGDTEQSGERYCSKMYSRCMDKGGSNTYFYNGSSQCNNCRVTCESQGYWPYNICAL